MTTQTASDSASASAFPSVSDSVSHSPSASDSVSDSPSVPTFQTLELSLDLVRSLATPLTALARRDPSLTQQLRRAASSVSLNLAEGNRRAGRDRLHLWRVAAGSADEVRACLRVAEAWGDLGREEIAPALGLCERVLGALWRLTHPRVSG